MDVAELVKSQAVHHAGAAATKAVVVVAIVDTSAVSVPLTITTTKD